MSDQAHHLGQVTFLGTATSQGVPVIACDCPVCLSADPRDKRLRSSILFESPSTNFVIDTGPDFRQQMLDNQVKEIHAVVLTHEHQDHVAGLDDVRPFNFRYNRDMPVYGEQRVLEDMKQRFSYIFKPHPYPGLPKIDLREINENDIFKINDIKIQPVRIIHGRLPILGFRIGDFTYLTDLYEIEEKEKEKVKGSKILVVSALHHKKHYSHLTLQEALEFIEEMQPEKAYLTHLSHFMGLHEEVEKSLPAHVRIAYDGLKIFI